jgi:hypothetical protein
MNTYFLSLLKVDGKRKRIDYVRPNSCLLFSGRFAGKHYGKNGTFLKFSFTTWTYKLTKDNQPTDSWFFDSNSYHYESTFFIAIPSKN